MRKLTDYLGLLILTAAAGILMLTISAGNDQLGWVFGDRAVGETANEFVVPKTPVTVIEAAPEAVELIQRYSGRIEPFESHSLAFEISGRLVGLGTNDEGEPLDDGDDVYAGQPLAYLDDVALLAMLDEAAATLEEMESELSRAQSLAAQGNGLITQADLTRNAKNAERAKARKRIAEKNLRDATLYAPFAAGGADSDQTGASGPAKRYRIARRLANVGESVNVHEPIFELLEVNRVLLIASVPESKIRDVEPGQDVHVELLARDPFGAPIPPVNGTVFRESEQADENSGAFEVEIVIDNREGQLKPGMIAVADIVVDTIENGYRLPIMALVRRQGQSLIFSVTPEGRADGLSIDRWIAQGPDLILPELPTNSRRIVTRGQHRLVTGREVDVVTLPAPDEEPVPAAELLIAAPTADGPE